MYSKPRQPPCILSLGGVPCILSLGSVPLNFKPGSSCILSCGEGPPLSLGKVPPVF